MRPFDEIVSEHGAVVLRVCRALVGPDDADDVWSETFLAAMRAYPELRHHGNVRGWLTTIARNKAIDHLRRRTRLPRAVGDVTALDAAAAGAAGEWAARGQDSSTEMFSEDLLAAVESLPPKQRTAVAHRYLGDLSYGQIAALLGGTEAAARRNAADGVARLRDRFPSLTALQEE